MTREDAIREMMFAKRNVIADSFIDKAFDMAIEALKEQKWIPCSERLPNEEERVLVCSDKGDIEISKGCVFDSTGEFEWYTSGWKFGTVVAWMPLPSPYKEEVEIEVKKNDK